jgi:uncharacterized membrane protein YhhN
MILALVMIASVAGLLAAEQAGSRIAIAVAKMTAASTFVAMALASGATTSTYGQILLGGLLLCWLGDALLLSPGRSAAFQLGIGAFLLGHLAYAAAFFVMGIDPVGVLVGGLVIGCFAWATLRWLRPHLPSDFEIAVQSYIGVISLMVACSVGVAVAGGPAIIAIGAIGFALSDLFVARERFVSPGFENSAWGLPLYFISQFVLASTAALVTPSI